jgi:hypothetical protein
MTKYPDVSIKMEEPQTPNQVPGSLSGVKVPNQPDALTSVLAKMAINSYGRGLQTWRNWKCIQGPETSDV